MDFIRIVYTPTLLLHLVSRILKAEELRIAQTGRTAPTAYQAWMDGWMASPRWMDGLTKMDGWMGWMGWMYGCMDGWMDGLQANQAN